MPNEALGALSREEQSLAPQLTAADMLAWLEAHRATITVGLHTEVRYDSGCVRVTRNSDDGIDTLLDKRCSTYREALRELIEHETGRKLRSGWL